MLNQPTAARVTKRLKNPLVLLLIAALLAGGVAWVTLQYLQKREEALKEELAASGKADAPRRVSVAVPLADAGVGTVLNLDTFVSRPVEEDLVYPDTVLAEDFMAMQGMKLARPVLRGRPLRVTDLQVPEVRDVAAVLPAGRRALTIEIDNINSISQTLRPNHHIDIYLLSKPEGPAAGGAPGAAGANETGDKGREQVSLYMQDMVVLATGTEFADVTRSDGPALEKMVRPGEIEGRSDGDYDTVTLLVTPEQAARLMVGQKLGTYRVVLRGEEDRARIAYHTLRGADVMGGAMRGRDAGIEFIVGGGGDKLISELAQAPSQDARVSAARARSAPAQAAPAQATPPAIPGRTTMTINAPTTRADQVIAQRKQ